MDQSEIELQRLAAESEIIDAENAPQEIEPPGEPAPPAPSSEDEARDVIGFAVALFVPIYPSLGKVYTPEKQARLAAVAAPLMEKYGITMGGIFAQWGPEINFLMVAAPVAIETAKAIREDKKPPAPDQKPLQAQHEIEQQPGQ